MARIRISGIATAWRPEDEADGAQITEADRLAYFAGLEYRRESLCDYLLDSAEAGVLAELDLTGGYLALGYDGAQNELLAITEYRAPRRLAADEIAALAAYTIGQWSDGVGSNFSQSFAVATRVSISIALSADEVKVEQFDD